MPGNTTIHIGHALEVLKTLPSESIDCCVTSPPYWGLRDYKTEPIIWDGVEGCEHEWGDEIPGDNRGGSGTPTDKNNRGEGYGRNVARGNVCRKCGAWKGQLGLEPTPQLYIRHLTAIFDEVKRVLKPSGTCWVNLGDSYASQGGPQVTQTKNASHGIEGAQESRKSREWSVPDKCLVQIPSRFAIAMADAGWILRNEIIWHKPNCMPSSVKDRFTVDFEKMFFFTKSKRYYFESQYEPMSEATKERDRHPYNHAFGNQFAGSPTDKRTPEGKKVDCPFYSEKGRNKRCVWSITTKPYKGAHFAVFPPELVETPIKAGCPEGGVVLDPFGGSGTTAMVANNLGRDAILIDLNSAYKPLMEARVNCEPASRVGGVALNISSGLHELPASEDPSEQAGTGVCEG